ncbi:hypothetical protein ACHWQZ_G000082 [Mnemiopsis leidyi]
MPEMIRYLTKKFSAHSLTEVKPAEHFTLQGHNPNQDQDFRDRNDNAEKKSLDEITCVENLSDGEAEDEGADTFVPNTSPEHPRPRIHPGDSKPETPKRFNKLRGRFRAASTVDADMPAAGAPKNAPERSRLLE